MRIKEGYVLREVADSFIVLQVSGEVQANRLITLNETGAFLWRLLENGATREEMIAKTEEEYDASRKRIEKDVDFLLSKMREANLLDE